MSLVRTPDRLQLPESLRVQLFDFRRRVWSIKLVEAVACTLLAVLCAYLALFVLDRLCETPAWARFCLFGCVAVGFALLPWALHRWVWGHRKLDQLARLLSRRHPHVGDQLLGVIELVRSDSEQSRSRTLCEAAVQQVAADAQHRNLRDAVPEPRHRLLAGLAAVPLLVALALLALFPAASANAWARLLAPWKDTPRYTFAVVEALPEKLVVAHGEPFTLTVRLAESTRAHPAQGAARIAGQAPVVAALRDGAYRFEIPPQLVAGTIAVDIGDAWHRLELEPLPRPEITALWAEVSLPEYLGLPEPFRKDVRGGAVSLVNGSRARFSATASRDLALATVNGQPVSTSGPNIHSPQVGVDGPDKVEFRWEDGHGLSGRQPFVLSINGVDDEAPSLVCEGLPHQRVVLDSEVLNFQVRARDDFGVRRVGFEWQGTAEAAVKSPSSGERLLAAGSNDSAQLDIAGTFSAKSLQIEPQPIELRVFVEDYLPGRERVYSPTFVLYVLSAEQHAIWLTEQLSKWHRQSLDVRDRELQLFETNKQLRAMSPDQLDLPDTRRRIETQATAERANGRRLSNLVANGEDLVKQATRNLEFGVGHLEKWAEMLQILKDISSNRMPSVADLLKQASQAPQAAAKSGENNRPMAGQSREAAGAAAAPKAADAKKPPADVPQVVDGESSQQPRDKNAPPPADKKPSNPRLTLAATTLPGKAGSQKPPPAAEKIDEAVRQQQDLLAEFDKIAEELNRVLAELEGSTLVKRLKAAARQQYKIGGTIGEQLAATFGLPAAKVDGESKAVLSELSEQEFKGSQNVSYIMDDMQAYFERRQFAKFKAVLDDMRQQDVIGSLRQLGDDMRKEAGLSIAQAEYWSDTLDRWAEDLVDPACKGCCPGCKSKGSLPPSIVLEVLLILEGEVNLREATRVAEQARGALSADEHKTQSVALSATQKELGGRVVQVVGRIRELPDAEEDFAKELRLLSMVAMVMDEAAAILAQPNTGSPAIAAETEAIELLLQSKRINPKAGGGGGSSPGGGGGGDTQDSALALLGSGVNDKEVREDRGVSQATGDAGAALPEEFRAGLDEYFNRLEGGDADSR